MVYTKIERFIAKIFTNRSLTGSNADVASSKRTIVGFRTIARAIETHRF